MIHKQNLKTKAKELTQGGDQSLLASRRFSGSLDIPALTASMGSVTDTLNYNWDYAYANEFPVGVQDLDVGKLRTIPQEEIGLIRGA
jgi:hypothetical protein